MPCLDDFLVGPQIDEKVPEESADCPCMEKKGGDAKTGSDDADLAHDSGEDSPHEAHPNRKP